MGPRRPGRPQRLATRPAQRGGLALCAADHQEPPADRYPRAAARGGVQATGQAAHQAARPGDEGHLRRQEGHRRRVPGGRAAVSGGQGSQRGARTEAPGVRFEGGHPLRWGVQHATAPHALRDRPGGSHPRDQREEPAGRPAGGRAGPDGTPSSGSRLEPAGSLRGGHRQPDEKEMGGPGRRQVRARGSPVQRLGEAPEGGLHHQWGGTGRYQALRREAASAGPVYLRSPRLVPRLLPRVLEEVCQEPRLSDMDDPQSPHQQPRRLCTAALDRPQGDAGHQLQVLRRGDRRVRRGRGIGRGRSRVRARHDGRIRGPYRERAPSGQGSPEPQADPRVR